LALPDNGRAPARPSIRSRRRTRGSSIYRAPPSLFDNFPPLNNLPDSQRFRICSHEKNISAFKTHSEAPIRVPRAHENQGWKSDIGPATSTRSETIDSRWRGNPFRPTYRGLRESMVRPGRISFELPRSSRLQRGSEFKLVRASGKSWIGTHLILAALHRETGFPSRVGIITTRRLGNAVVRNRIRRKIREIFRLNQHHVRQGYWVVTIARVSSAFASYQELERDWLRLAKRASILEPTPHGSHPADLTQSV
jgi:ribonuclease P protein component